MALDVNFIYQLALRIIKKNQSGSLSSLDFAYHWNAAQSTYFSDLLGRFLRSANGKSGINTGLIENQTIMTKLSPFINPATLTIASGTSNKPPDFCFELSLRINDETVVHIDHDQIASVKGSVIDSPSIADGMFYCIEYLNYYSFLPNTVTTASLDYVAFPVNVFWGYTFDVNNRQVYDAGTSTQPQWDNASSIEITERMLKTLGVSFSSQDFENFGESIIKNGS